MRLRLIESVRRTQRIQTQIRATRATDLVSADSLAEFIPALSPEFAAPRHLAPLLDVLERAPHGRLRVVVSVPPRHGKTEALMHAVARWLTLEPSLAVMYLSYGAKLAYSKSRRMRSLAVKAGVRLSKDAKNKGEWLTPEEGGLRAAGIDGDVIGHGAGVLLFDDPHKNRSEAESSNQRDHVWGQFESAARTRLEPDGSIILVQQRWNDDDCAARAIKLGYQYICLPALDEYERALWPERFTREDLIAIRRDASPYDWASMYLGNPQPREGRVFVDAALCDEREVGYGRTSIGVDLAHTATTRSDYQAAVVMTEVAGVYYVHDVRNERSKLTDDEHEGRTRRGFVSTLRDLRERYSGPMGMYVARQENALLEIISSMPDGVHIEARRADRDKWLRAQPFATAWQQGRVRVVRDQSWTDAFVAQLASFSGSGDAHDDMVDAAACAFDLLGGSAGVTVSSPRTERGSAMRGSSGRRLYT